MATRQQLKQRRAPIGAAIRALADKVGRENRDFTYEERKDWDRLNTEFDTLTRRIKGESADPDQYGSAADRSAEVAGELGRRDALPPGLPVAGANRGVPDSREQRREQAQALALQGWFRHQSGQSLTDDQSRACKRTGLHPARRSVDLILPRRPEQFESRSLSATVGSSGAFTISTGFMGNLEKALKAFNGVRQVADVLRTDTGAEMSWPTVNDTTNKGRRLGENQPVTTKDPTFGQVIFRAYKYTSDLILAPAEWLEDTPAYMASELAAMLGERVGRIQEEEDTTGTGNGMPQGVAVAAAVGKTAGGATAITGDDIIDLIHSVDPAYRNDPSFRLMFHDLILAAIRKVKDSQGRYLFEEGQNGAPNKIKGVEYVINQNMPSSIASGNRTMLAGPFRKYKVRDVNRIRIRRFDERYGDTDQVGFVAFMRHDGRLLDAGAQPIKALVQP